MNPGTIILSRTDSIGDVVLTLPMAGILKEKYPDCKIIFLGRAYTRSIVQLSEHVDCFEDYDAWEVLSEETKLSHLKALHADVFIHVFPNKELAKLAKKAGIKCRIGTSHRAYHFLTCNKRPNFTRKGSDLHEAQLNFKLLAPLDIDHIPQREELPSYYGFSKIPTLPEKFSSLIEAEKKNIVLHPKSKGSAVEWGLDNFKSLIEVLPTDRCNIFITGTEQEGELLKGELPLDAPNIHNLTGKMSLNELIAFIAACDSLVAASTGPLHVAAAVNIKAIGLFVDVRPIHPGRWAPLGTKAQVLTYDGEIAAGEEKAAILKISPERVMGELLG